MEPQLPDYLTTAQQGAETAAKDVASISSYAGSMPDALKKSIQQAYQDNQDVISQLDTATADYLQAPSEARVKFQDIWNPFQRENLVSQYTSNKAIPMMSWSGIYGQRMGRAGDLLNAGVGAYESDVAAKQAAAELAQQTYENALNQYQLEEDRRRWEAEQAAQDSLLKQIMDAIDAIKNQGQEEPDPIYEETPAGDLNNYSPYVSRSGITNPGYANTGNYSQMYSPVQQTLTQPGAGIMPGISGLSLNLGKAPSTPAQNLDYNSIVSPLPPPWRNK